EDENFYPIPKTPEESEEESNDEEEQDLRLSKEARIQEEEDADELYRDVNINQGRGLQVTQNVEDTHVTLTPVNPNGPQETFRFEERLKSLETSFSEYRQTNQFADAVSAIPGIVHQYMTQQMTEAVREAVQIQIDWVKEQVPRILPRIKESVNATLETKVLTRSSQSSRTSYANAADLSEMELKKILIEKIEGNKSIQRSDEQRNLYKA
nr:hypothetical protein [Tanacetum cinerariifolium]